MKRNILLTILLWALWLAPFGVVVADGRSARPLGLGVALLLGYFFACSRFAGTSLCPRWMRKFIGGES